MIYVILYTTLAPGKLFNELELCQEVIRKEIWLDDGRGYRRLIKDERYRAPDILEERP